jgi:hypothetical protein
VPPPHVVVYDIHISAARRVDLAIPSNIVWQRPSIIKTGIILIGIPHLICGMLRVHVPVFAIRVRIIFVWEGGPATERRGVIILMRRSTVPISSNHVVRESGSGSNASNAEQGSNNGAGT